MYTNSGLRIICNNSSLYAASVIMVSSHELYTIYNVILFPSLGSDDYFKFQGNDSTIDHFKLVLRDGNSLLVGGR